MHKHTLKLTLQVMSCSQCKAKSEENNGQTISVCVCVWLCVCVRLNKTAGLFGLGIGIKELGESIEQHMNQQWAKVFNHKHLK